MKTYVTKAYDRLDKICDEVYGTANSRVTERVIDATPGLETYGFLLPAGLTLNLPDLADTSIKKAPLITQIKLWD